MATAAEDIELRLEVVRSAVLEGFAMAEGLTVVEEPAVLDCVVDEIVVLTLTVEDSGGESLIFEILIQASRFLGPLFGDDTVTRVCFSEHARVVYV